MKKIWFASTFLLAIPIYASQYEMRFVEFQNYREVGGLPPELKVTFRLECNDKFLKVVREEIDGETVTIGVGGVVLRDQSLDCVTPPTDVEASAGNTFSGRPYEIVRIVR